MKYIAVVLLFFCYIEFDVYAQNSHVLSKEEENEIKARIVDKLEDFQFWLEEIADKKNSQQVRTSAYESNVLLFIGKCEPYTVTNISTGVLEKKEAVKTAANATK